MTRQRNKGNIQLRKLITVNKSTAIIIPPKFTEKMQLTPGNYVKLELNNKGDSIIVERVSLDG